MQKKYIGRARASVSAGGCKKIPTPLVREEVRYYASPCQEKTLLDHSLV